MSDIQRLLQEIAEEARETAEYTGRSRFADEVMAALASVPRERFVGADQAEEAYWNIPLSIGCQQTISQPYIVALMTDLLDLAPVHSCLEVGTGSGYQTAILARLAAEVYTLEVIETLYRRADRRLAALGCDNVHRLLGDGSQGYPQAAPYDRVIVTAAAAHWPEPLLEQLAPGGVMVIPIGEPWGGQMLYRVEKSADGQIDKQGLLPVRFVPLVESQPSSCGRS